MTNTTNALKTVNALPCGGLTLTFDFEGVIVEAYAYKSRQWDAVKFESTGAVTPSMVSIMGQAWEAVPAPSDVLSDYEIRESLRTSWADVVGA